MDRAETRQFWADNKDRPAAVREHADAIGEHTNTSEAVPSGSLYDVRQWLDSYKATVTRQLNEDESGESDLADDTEGGDNA